MFLLVSDGSEVSADEKVDHDFVPFGVLGKLSSKDHDFSGQHPENEGDGFRDSVVARDNNINVVERCVGVAEGNARDIDV